MKSILIIIFLFADLSLYAQNERLTKGAENGYAWQRLEDPSMMYNTSKENYLSSILERLKLTQERYPEIASLGCRDEIDELQRDEKSNQISLEDVVEAIDKFYSNKENMKIPIIFAYCYSIKKFSGASKKELDIYRKSVLKFCGE